MFRMPSEILVNQNFEMSEAFVVLIVKTQFAKSKKNFLREEASERNPLKSLIVGRKYEKYELLLFYLQSTKSVIKDLRVDKDKNYLKKRRSLTISISEYNAIPDQT